MHVNFYFVLKFVVQLGLTNLQKLYIHKKSAVYVFLNNWTCGFFLKRSVLGRNERKLIQDLRSFGENGVSVLFRFQFETVALSENWQKLEQNSSVFDNYRVIIIIFVWFNIKIMSQLVLNSEKCFTIICQTSYDSNILENVLSVFTQFLL